MKKLKILILGVLLFVGIGLNAQVIRPSWGTITVDNIIVTGVAKFADGSAAAPSITFINDTDLGFYRSGANILRVSVGGSEKWQFNGSLLLGSATNGPAMASETASATNPTLLPNKVNLTTGIGAIPGADSLSLIAGGVEGLRIVEGGGDVQAQFADGTAALPAMSFITYPTTGLYIAAPNNIGFSFSGSSRYTITTDAFKDVASTNGAAMLRESSSATNPVWSFNGDTGTGIGRAGADAGSLIAGSKEIARFYANTVEQFIINPQGDLTGTASSPSLAFHDGTGDFANNGFYMAADNTLHVTVDGSAQFNFTVNSFEGINGNAPRIYNLASSATSPVIQPKRGDSNTGIGGTAGDNGILSLISDGTEVVRVAGGAIPVTTTAGGRIKEYAIKAADYTATAGDYYIEMSTASTLTLPAISGITGTEYKVINTSGGNVTIDGNASETIGNTSPTTTITVASGDAVVLVANGTIWRIN